MASRDEGAYCNLQGSFIWRVLLEFGIYAAPPSAKNCLKAGLQQGFRSTRSQMKEPCCNL